ncbi:hypothetical protein E0Z10_g1616 [Xylaria hypoxylon]|uniref:Uncharacterized protein n=1 Tax=Xylaria hypoxylon TaxID=37992 RepID=A0A4Z0Z8B1_9PEZI|nr:hypothetical protein E0Z10_g1616 [Xylaria hypoxylon]
MEYPSNAALRRRLDNFASQAPPQYSIDTIPSTQAKPGISAARGAFLKFINSDGAGCWLVHVPSPGCSAVETAEQVFQWTEDLIEQSLLDGPRELFSFDADNGHSDSAEAALYSLLAELYSHFPRPEEKEFAQEALKFFDICHSTQVQDLYFLYVGLVLVKLKSRGVRPATSPEATFTIILGNLDGRIRNGAWLFKKLEGIVHDCGLRLKVIVTSSDPASLKSDVGSATFVGSPGLGLANPPYRLEKPARPENDVKLRSSPDSVMTEDGRDEDAAFLKSVLALIQHRPQLYGYSVGLNLLAQSCGEDEMLWEMISNWLKDLQFPSEDRLQDSISQLIPATPDKVFRSMLTSLPSQIRSWSILLLERVSFAFRPLTLLELIDLELLDWPDEPQHGIPGASTMRGVTDRVCGGLLTVRRNEIHLAHPKLRGFLLTSAEQVLGRAFSFDSASSIHGRIATTCLTYLASPMRRQLMGYRAGPGRWHTSFECRKDFLSYAVKYWLRHAMRAGKDIFESDACTRFLADNEVVRLWVILYRGLSPPVATGGMPSIDILASLTIFAEHEAEDLLISSIRKHQELGTPDLSFACFTALVEAAGRGNMRMIKGLLAFPLLEGEALDQPILAAIESGNKDVFDEITNLGQKARGRIQDFTPLLARAASLGRADFAKTLLDMIKTSGVDIGSSHSLSPLSYACQRGYGEVVELLISEGGATVMNELKVQHYTPLPIQLAVQFGEIDILNILRCAVAKRPEDSAAIEYCRSIFTESSGFGRRRPVRNILDYVDRHLQRETSTPKADGRDVSKEVDEENTVMSYLHHKLIYRDNSWTHPKNAFTKVIEQWPHAIDLVDFLTGPKQSIMRDPQFPSYFEIWMEAAVSSGDIAVVKVLFENGAKSPWATAQVLEHVTILGFRKALLNQFIPCLKYLIEKGANFTSYRLSYGRTPLFDAAYNGLVAAVKVLIETTVDVNAPGNDIWFPIHACYDNAEITRLLIVAGADVDVLTTGSDEQTSLHFAVIWGFSGVVDELLKAKPSRKTLQSGLEAAVMYNQIHMMENILPHCPDASYLQDIDNLLHYQVKGSSLKNLQLLLSHQYQLDIDKKDSYGNTALHYISANTSAEVVELLIKHGAGIEQVNHRGATPLAVAAGVPNESVVRCLVEHGALINTAAGSCEGPFILACLRGSLDMVKIMHTSKTDPADVNRLSHSGSRGTALNSALMRLEETNDRQGIIQYLLEEGHAEVNTLTMFWSGALQVACLTSTVEIVRMLIKQYHANVNAKDNTGRTPLHIALYRTREHVELLLEHGAKLDAVDIINRNALHFAVLSGRLDVVKLVLDKQPNFVNQKDAHGWTPLLWALRVTGKWGTQTSEMQAIVQELLGCGAHRLVRGEGIDRTWTPMKIAKYYRVSEDVMELLAPIPEDFEKMGDEYQDWDWRSGGGKRAIFGNDSGWCDHCLLVRVTLSSMDPVLGDYMGVGTPAQQKDVAAERQLIVFIAISLGTSRTFRDIRSSKLGAKRKTICLTLAGRARVVDEYSEVEMEPDDQLEVEEDVEEAGEWVDEDESEV